MCAHTHTDTNMEDKYERIQQIKPASELKERNEPLLLPFVVVAPPRTMDERAGQDSQAGRRTERQMTDWLAGTCQSENRDIISAWHELKSIMTNILQSVRSLHGLRVRTACQREWTCVFVHVSLYLCVCLRLSACVAQVFSPCALFSLRFVVALLLRLDTSVAVWSRILFK